MERTQFYDDDKNIALQSFLQFLSEKAVPKYFDSVSIVGADLICTIGNTNFLTFSNFGESESPSKVTVTTSTGVSIEMPIYEKGATDDYPLCAITCKDGILAETRYGNFIICKDEKGDTAVAITGYTISNVYRYTKNKLYSSHVKSVGVNDEKITGYFCCNPENANITALCPLPTFSARGTWLKGVWEIQYNPMWLEGEFSLNGIDLFAIGNIAIQD